MDGRDEWYGLPESLRPLPASRLQAVAKLRSPSLLTSAIHTGLLARHVGPQGPFKASLRLLDLALAGVEAQEHGGGGGAAGARFHRLAPDGSTKLGILVDSLRAAVHAYTKAVGPQDWLLHAAEQLWAAAQRCVGAVLRPYTWTNSVKYFGIGLRSLALHALPATLPNGASAGVQPLQGQRRCKRSK